MRRDKPAEAASDGHIGDPPHRDVSTNPLAIQMSVQRTTAQSRSRDERRPLTRRQTPAVTEAAATGRSARVPQTALNGIKGWPCAILTSLPTRFVSSSRSVVVSTCSFAKPPV